MGSGFRDAPVLRRLVVGPGVEVPGPHSSRSLTVVVLPPGATARSTSSQLRAHGFVACTCVPIYFDPESTRPVRVRVRTAHRPRRGTPGRHRLASRLHPTGCSVLCRRSPPDLGRAGAFSGSARRARRRSPSFLRSRASRKLALAARIRRLAGHRRARVNGRCGVGSRNTATGPPSGPTSPRSRATSRTRARRHTGVKQLVYGTRVRGRRSGAP